jgi:hypothetical protein
LHRVNYYIHTEYLPLDSLLMGITSQRLSGSDRLRIIAFIMMMRKVLLSFVWLCVVLSAGAQSDYSFKQGLAADSLHHYGREALVTDLLTHTLFTGKFTTPAASAPGVTSPAAANTISWSPITADSAGLFKGGRVIYT